MKYTKPEITSIDRASFAVMSQQKQSPVSENAFTTTTPAYEADE